MLQRLCARLGLAHDDARLVKFTSNAVFDLPGDRVVVRLRNGEIVGRAVVVP